MDKYETKATGRMRRDWVLALLMAAIGYWLYWVDPANAAILQSCAIGMFLVISSHFTRRILFSKLNLQTLALKAAETPTGAAVVFAAICGFIISVMWIGIRAIA